MALLSHLKNPSEVDIQIQCMINEQDSWQGKACKHFLYISFTTAPKENYAVTTVTSP